jgi:hypothetical protein
MHICYKCDEGFLKAARRNEKLGQPKESLKRNIIIISSSYTLTYSRYERYNSLMRLLKIWLLGSEPQSLLQEARGKRYTSLVHSVPTGAKTEVIVKSVCYIKMVIYFLQAPS